MFKISIMVTILFQPSFTLSSCGSGTSTLGERAGRPRAVPRVRDTSTVCSSPKGTSTHLPSKVFIAPRSPLSPSHTRHSRSCLNAPRSRARLHPCPPSHGVCRHFEHDLEGLDPMTRPDRGGQRVVAQAWPTASGAATARFQRGTARRGWPAPILFRHPPLRRTTLPGRKPPKRAVKRPSRPHQSTKEKRFPMENAKAA
jgi:hypothetical protein